MRSFRFTLVVLWALGSVAGVIHSQDKGFPLGVTIPVLVAMLVELSLYAGLAFQAVRDRLQSLGAALPAAMVTSALVPYLIATLSTGAFEWRWFLTLFGVAVAASWWFLALPRLTMTDLAFLVLVAGVYMSKVFRDIYPDPADGLRIDILGQLMWIRLGVLAVLLLRHLDGLNFGFWPDSRDWLIGIAHYLLFMPLGAALMYGLEFARFDPADGWWWKAPGTFIGILWVVALGEEVFFRGMLQQWLMRRFGTRAGLVIAAVVFGACHLPFRQFPNWQFAILAAVAGWFYGRAFIHGRGIRAAMVAHALTVSTWRTLFQ